MKRPGVNTRPFPSVYPPAWTAGSFPTRSLTTMDTRDDTRTGLRAHARGRDGRRLHNGRAHRPGHAERSVPHRHPCRASRRSMACHAGRAAGRPPQPPPRLSLRGATSRASSSGCSVASASISVCSTPIASSSVGSPLGLLQRGGWQAVLPDLVRGERDRPDLEARARGTASALNACSLRATEMAICQPAGSQSAK